MALLAALAAASLGIPAYSQAQVVFGQLAPGMNPAAVCLDQVDVVQVGVGSGSPYEIDRKGVLTSWSTNAAAADGQKLTFKLMRPTMTGYTVVAHDGPRSLIPGAVNRFHLGIPVLPHDVLAVNMEAGSVHNACLFSTGVSRDNYSYTNPLVSTDTPDGSMLPALLSNSGFRLNLSVTLLEAPKISSIEPAEGDVAGGAPVVLKGVNLAEVQSVTFGGVPARKFSVESEGRITAIAPGGAGPGQVPVAVTTVAGTDSVPEGFEYVRRPAITALSPNAGSVSGGESVKIVGSDFSGAESVTFGGVPATEYRVASGGEIIAVTPPSTKLGVVPVSVTTEVGSSPGPQGFTYLGCLVPKLTGKSIRAARVWLRLSDCRLGKVKRKGGSKARVLRQSPKPGTLLAPGGTVSVMAGARHHHG